MGAEVPDAFEGVEPGGAHDIFDGPDDHMCASAWHDGPVGEEEADREKEIEKERGKGESIARFEGL